MTPAHLLMMLGLGWVGWRLMNRRGTAAILPPKASMQHGYRKGPPKKKEKRLPGYAVPKPKYKRPRKPAKDYTL